MNNETQCVPARPQGELNNQLSDLSGIRSELTELVNELTVIAQALVGFAEETSPRETVKSDTQLSRMIGIMSDLRFEKERLCEIVNTFQRAVG